MSKSKGELLSDALVASGFTVVPWVERGNRERDQFELASIEYDKANTTDLPADVLAFVEGVEARAAKASPGPWHTKIVSSYYGTSGVASGPHEDVVGMYGASAANSAFIAPLREDAPTLCRIVRGQVATNSGLQEDNSRYWAHAIDCQAERDALRERVAHIEVENTALRYAANKAFDAYDNAPSVDMPVDAHAAMAALGKALRGTL